MRRHIGQIFNPWDMNGAYTRRSLILNSANTWRKLQDDMLVSPVNGRLTQKNVEAAHESGVTVASHGWHPAEAVAWPGTPTTCGQRKICQHVGHF
jgi:hypothetical protein